MAPLHLDIDEGYRIPVSGSCDLDSDDFLSWDELFDGALDLKECVPPMYGDTNHLE